MTEGASLFKFFGLHEIASPRIMGTRRVAGRTAATFPFEMTYTLQKSGVHFSVLAGISVALNNLYVRRISYI